MQKSVGSIVVTEKGTVVFITATDIVGEMQGNGTVPIFDVGVILRGAGMNSVGSRCTIKNTEGLRVVGHVGELVRLLEATGIDLNARPEKPLSSLNPMERLERLERENAQLKAAVK